MEKVYAVFKEDCYDLGCYDTEIKVFKTYEKVKEYFEKSFEEYLNGIDMKLEDLKDYDEADDEDWVLEEEEDLISCYPNGCYIESHYKSYIQESEVE